MTFSLVQKRRGFVTEFPIAAYQLYVCGLYVMLENGQQLNLDRASNTPRVKDNATGKITGLQTFIKKNCVGGSHAA
jgi:hypothetical protein